VRIWYDTVMERISGWYKRRSQFVLFLVGLVLRVRDEHRRAATVAAPVERLGADRATGAEAAAAPAAAPAADATPLDLTKQAKAQAQSVQELPIGWPSARFTGVSGFGAISIALCFALLGWIATAFAASLGSPFWFDGIGWLLALRGTGAKPENHDPPAATVTLPT
jgi:hypothetical protein